MQDNPKFGFYELSTIINEIPISESGWWAGVKTGKYPKPIKHGRRTFWKVKDIHTLIESIERGAGDA